MIATVLAEQCADSFDTRDVDFFIQWVAGVTRADDVQTIQRKVFQGQAM